MGEKSGSLKMLRTKGLAQDQSTRLYIFYFSDPRSHWVYKKSQYYQEGMRCCLMACLLKVHSDMLQSPQLLSHIHIWPKPKVKLGPTDSFHPAPPSSDVIATATNLGKSVSPRWDCNLFVSLRNVSVPPRWVIGPTELLTSSLVSLLPKSVSPSLCNRSHRDYVMP